eukprot:jgi/Tetstr1/435950/TSEL_024831.t1
MLLQFLPRHGALRSGWGGRRELLQGAGLPGARDTDRDTLLAFKATLPQNCTSLGCADGPIFRKWDAAEDICNWQEDIGYDDARGVTRCERGPQHAEKIDLRGMGLNHFTGTLPPEWSSLGSRVDELDLKLERNQLVGTLPPEWALGWEGLTVHLSMDRNNLDGSIPASWASIRFEELALAGNAGLCGRYDGFAWGCLAEVGHTLLGRSCSDAGVRLHGQLPPCEEEEEEEEVGGRGKSGVGGGGGRLPVPPADHTGEIDEESKPLQGEGADAKLPPLPAHLGGQRSAGQGAPDLAVLLAAILGGVAALLAVLLFGLWVRSRRRATRSGAGGGQHGSAPGLRRALSVSSRAVPSWQSDASAFTSAGNASPSGAGPLKVKACTSPPEVQGLLAATSISLSLQLARLALVVSGTPGKATTPPSTKAPRSSGPPWRLSPQGLGEAGGLPLLPLPLPLPASPPLAPLRRGLSVSRGGGIAGCPEVDWAADVKPYVVERLGEGAFGSVLRIESPKWAPQRASFQKEIELMMRCDGCDRIVKLYGARLRAPKCCIVQEYIPGGSLEARIYGSGAAPLSYLQVLRLGRDIAEGLAYLHPTIVHRDLKPANILLDADGRAKLIDFGLSRHKDIMRSYLLTTEVGGTPLYMAPEMFDGGAKVTEKVDVYSLAMIMYECYTRQRPWPECFMTVQVVFAVRVNGERPPLPQDCPPDLARLIEKCWATEPLKRPSCHEVIKFLDYMIAEAEGGAPARTPRAGPCRSDFHTALT